MDLSGSCVRTIIVCAGSNGEAFVWLEPPLGWPFLVVGSGALLPAMICSRNKLVVVCQCPFVSVPSLLQGGHSDVGEQDLVGL